ncbi:MAG: FAD-binding oxidoreductase [Crocinitomicaceae bacterium]|nr:FAD-binding oxidoreductase [Crocinitomicaceae bacterium]
MNQQHYLIVGAGLSGICVAEQLMSKNQRVSIIDSNENKSSIVAAGLINPLVFRRMAKSWRVDELLPYAQDFYRKLEQKTAQEFYHEIVIRRFFSSEQERGFWEKKQTEDEYLDYMFPLTEEDKNYSEFNLKNDYGSARVKQSAWVNASVFLSEMHEELKAICTFFSEKFDYSLLDTEKAVYKGIAYDGIIFCEGYMAQFNPWFGHLPIQSTKGEVLTIHSTDLPMNESINRKCFVLPISTSTYKVGSTYKWETPDTIPTEEGKQELIDHFHYLSDIEPKILEHDAGIRPTTLDRRPIIGRHELFPKLSIFNGMGAKGYLIAPLLSKEFADYLVDGQPLLREIDIQRIKKNSSQ